MNTKILLLSLLMAVSVHAQSSGILMGSQAATTVEVDSTLYARWPDEEHFGHFPSATSGPKFTKLLTRLRDSGVRIRAMSLGIDPVRVYFHTLNVGAETIEVAVADLKNGGWLALRFTVNEAEFGEAAVLHPTIQKQKLNRDATLFSYTFPESEFYPIGAASDGLVERSDSPGELGSKRPIVALDTSIPLHHRIAEFSHDLLDYGLNPNAEFFFAAGRGSDAAALGIEEGKQHRNVYRVQWDQVSRKWGPIEVAFDEEFLCLPNEDVEIDGLSVDTWQDGFPGIGALPLTSDEIVHVLYSTTPWSSVAEDHQLFHVANLPGVARKRRAFAARQRGGTGGIIIVGDKIGAGQGVGDVCTEDPSRAGQPGSGASSMLDEAVFATLEYNRWSEKIAASGCLADRQRFVSHLNLAKSLRPPSRKLKLHWSTTTKGLSGSPKEKTRRIFLTDKRRWPIRASILLGRSSIREGAAQLKYETKAYWSWKDSKGRLRRSPLVVMPH